jgi:hypothetical protein
MAGGELHVDDEECCDEQSEGETGDRSADSAGATAHRLTATAGKRLAVQLLLGWWGGEMWAGCVVLVHFFFQSMSGEFQSVGGGGSDSAGLHLGES